MSRRPTRPLPSRNGWMVSNCTWARAALTRIGSWASWRNLSRLPIAAATSVGGGGTNRALPGRVPPSQFWVRRNSPGAFVAAAYAGHQPCVDLAQQAVAQRQLARLDPPDAVRSSLRRSWTSPRRRRAARPAPPRSRTAAGRRARTACPRSAMRGRPPCARRSRGTARGRAAGASRRRGGRAPGWPRRAAPASTARSAAAAVVGAGRAGKPSSHPGRPARRRAVRHARSTFPPRLPSFTSSRA